jgi:hypothetical protein
MQYFREVEVSLGGAFKWVIKEGFSAGEPLSEAQPP